MLRLVLLAVVALIVLGIYFGYREASAESQARAFCEEIEPGSELATVENAVEGVGEDRLRLRYEGYLTVGFTGIPPFSRHLCNVYHDGRIVTSAQYRYLD